MQVALTVIYIFIECAHNLKVYKNKLSKNVFTKVSYTASLYSDVALLWSQINVKSSHPIFPEIAKGFIVMASGKG